MGAEVGFGGVGGRDFDHGLWLVNFPAFADEGLDDALIVFGAGLVGVAEVSFHVLVAGDFEGVGGGVVQALDEGFSCGGVENDKLAEVGRGISCSRSKITSPYCYGVRCGVAG